MIPSRSPRTDLAEQLAPAIARLRGSYSIVRPVSQVILELRRQGSTDPFVIARNAVINWVKDRAGRPLPPQALRGEAFELEDVGSQRTAAVSINHPRYWAARLDDSEVGSPRLELRSGTATKWSWERGFCA